MTLEWRQAYAFLGGALAWFLHLLAVYVVGEGLCLLPASKMTWLGVSLATWLVSVLTMLGLTIALSAAFTSYRLTKGSPAGETAAGTLFIGRAGLLTNLLFAVIILAQALPVFFLGGCG